MSTLLLSIHPKYVDSMRRGEKTCELRKVFPRPETKAILIYETAPTKALVGAAVVDAVTWGERNHIRDWTRSRAGVSRDDFFEYFSDPKATAVSIWLSQFVWLPEPIPLNELRRREKGFHPPQSYRYLCGTEVSILTRHAEMSWE